MDKVFDSIGSLLGIHSLNFLDLAGFILGILYLVWEYKANPKMWIAELVMPLIMMWLFFKKGIYGDCAMNAYYFFIAIYGYIVWTRHRNPQGKGKENEKKRTARSISHIPMLQLLVCLGAFITFYCVIAFLLIVFTDSTVPYLDAFTTSLSIVAMWMLAQKYVEQWFAWILVDCVSCWLYFYKGLPWSGVRYGIYTAVAIFGYFNWLRLMRRQKTADTE